MTIQEIQQAITELSPNELILFRKWFEEFDRNTKSRKLPAVQLITEEHLDNLRGSLKGTGGLQALMEERRKGR